jgi:hypothetical protein
LNGLLSKVTREDKILVYQYVQSKYPEFENILDEVNNIVTKMNDARDQKQQKERKEKAAVKPYIKI